jgi:hypothetical protein
VKSINCTGFLRKKIIHVNSASELKFTHTGFSKEKEKKLFTLMNSTTVEHSCSVVPPPREAAKCCFYKTCGTAEFLVGPTSINHCFFIKQTVIFVAAGEPHPQPHYQTGT